MSTKIDYSITPLYKKMQGIKVGDRSVTVINPSKIVKVSDNEVYAVYGKYKQTWTAEGSGNERHNFVEKIEEVSGS